MAARENQGLQIALIIFVMLAIILSVTTFIFFDGKQTATALATANATKADDAQKLYQEAGSQNDQFKQLLGFAQADDLKKSLEAANNEIKMAADMYSPKLGLEDRNYSKLVTALVGTLADRDKKYADAQKQIETLNQTIAQERAAKAQVVQTHSTDKDKAKAEFDSKIRENDSNLAALNVSKTEAKSLLDKRDADFQALKATSDKTIKDLQGDVAKLRKTVTESVTKIKDLTDENPTIPDGKVAWVNQRENVVFVNLGSQDGLQRRITFSVFDKDATHATKAIKKGNIEVLSIHGPHLAEARILENTNNDPIVPGDIIYTPLWHPGQIQHFAIAGEIDFDGDGDSDRAKLKELIAYNGGVVDAELDDKGKITGKMSQRTRFLVLGQTPSEKSAAGKIEGWSVIQGEADALGVEKIKVEDFLDLVGYSRGTKSLISTESGPKTKNANTIQSDGNKKSGSDFRERTPPGNKSGESAF